MLIEELLPNINLESSNIEFKRILEEGDKNGKRLEMTWLKELVGFANALGGSLYVGIDDQTHEVYALDHQKVDKIVLMMNRLIKEHIEPELVYRVKEINVPNTNPTRYVLKIDIEKAKNPPIILKFNGINSIYVRHYGLTSMATGEEIRDLVMNSDNISYDEIFIDKLYNPEDFKILNEAYRETYNRELTTKELISIGFISIKGKLSRGAELFLDNYKAEKTLIECCQFLGFSKGDDIFFNTKTICANLLVELKEVREFILNRSANGFIKTNNKQEELIAFPMRALNEAIINALAHRNYYINGSQIEINLYKDRLEIISPGSLPGSKFLNKEKNLSSIPPIRRNQVISNVFAMLKLMEKRGSGFDKICEDYSMYGDKYSPYATSSSNYFSLTLPDLTFRDGPVSENDSPSIYINEDDYEKNDLKILSFCYNKARSASQIAKYLDITPSSYFRKDILERLVKKGYLLKNKVGKTFLYQSNHNLVYPKN